MTLGYFELLITAACLSVIVTSILVRLAPRLGVVDVPHALGLHATPTPRVGGLAIFISFVALATAALMGLVPLSPLQRTQLLGLLLGSSIIVIVGFLDDMRRIAPEVKFSWEVLGALVAIIYGVQIGTVPALSVALPLTVLCLVGGANALNLLDGMDGLAAGVAAIGALFLGIMAVMAGNLVVALVCTLLLGGILGFLPYNLHPARTFMGDSGSLQLGFLLAAAAALLSNQPYNWVWFAAPLLVLGLPFLDTAGALVRRRRAGVDLFRGDRRHIYDLVLKRGASYWKTVVALWVGSLGLGLAALVATGLGEPASQIVLGAATAAAIACALCVGLFTSGPKEHGLRKRLTAASSGPEPRNLAAAADYREASS